jgi:hypothetical protein
LNDVDEEDWQNVERKLEKIEEGQGHKGRVGVKDVVLVNLKIEIIRFHSVFQQGLL